MKIGVIQFPGSNCERETSLALQRCGMIPVPFMWNQDPSVLLSLSGYIIVGGFSYEDRSRAGVIAALDPLMDRLREAVDQHKPVLGICNGAQILVESGLVPGVNSNGLAMALTHNRRLKAGACLGHGYQNEWVHVLAPDKARILSPFLRYLNEPLSLPIAHGEGCFVMAEELADELEARGQCALIYCDSNGTVCEDYPINPNGSMRNLAAVSNRQGNVLAMMPHPERCKAGDALFRGMAHGVHDRMELGSISSLQYQPSAPSLQTYDVGDNVTVVVESLITDHHGLSVELALSRRNIQVKVRRFLHWEIQGVGEADVSRMIEQDVFFNRAKEKAFVLSHDAEKFKPVYVLVQDKNDGAGLLMNERISALCSECLGVRKGVLWQLNFPHGQEHQLQDVLSSHVLFNPFASNGYIYG